MVKTIKVQDTYYELIKETADQLDTSIKEVVEGILDWFFTMSVDLDDEDEDEEEE